jgi:hypothetical protein
MYRKPIHTGRYLHFSSNHHVTWKGESFIAWSVEESKNVRHVLMLNEYQQEYFDSIIKPSRRNRPSSDTIYQGTVIIPYVKSISEKFRCIGNRFNVRTIFKTKHALRGTIMKTGPVRDAEQVLGLMCVEFFNVCLNSSRWFMLCLVYISYLALVLVSGDRN